MDEFYRSQIEQGPTQFWTWFGLSVAMIGIVMMGWAGII